MRTTRRLSLWIVDAFASRAFEGNQAAVVLVDRALSDAARQKVAAEINLAETAFVEIDDDDKGGCAGGADRFAQASRFVLRWFTPTTEVPLCGHATLAAAHVIVSELHNQHRELRFRTVRGAGELVVQAAPPSAAPPPTTAMLEMSLPLAEPRDPLPAGLSAPAQRRALVEALGLRAGLRQEEGGGDDGGVLAADPEQDLRFAAAGGLNYLLVEARSAEGGAESAAAVARLLREMPAPDAARLAATCREGLAGVIVAVRGGEGQARGESYRCTSRFFAPWMGIHEDSVTGSAHSVLGPHFDDGDGGGGRWWCARQASPRGGDVRVCVDRAEGRVRVAGEAVVVVRGEVEVPEDE